MTHPIDRFEAIFPDQPPTQTPARPAGVITDDYQRKLQRLGQRWRTVLDQSGDHGYPSASEADMALIDALVKRRFTEAEVWETIQNSPRYEDRVTRKGQRHADKLYAAEIAKAFREVDPFPEDPPNAPRQQRAAPPKPQLRTPLPAKTPPPPVVPITPWKPSTSRESFITRYVAYASQRTDAPPEAHELMAVGALSALAGPGPRLPIAATIGGWKLNLWMLYIVNSTVGRKSTVLNLSQDVMERVLGETAFLQWEGSPQGFIQRLQERDGKPSVFMRDEYSGLLQQMNRGGHTAGLAQTLIRAYDGRVIENIRTRKMNRDSGKIEKDIDRVADPYLVTLSASTRDSFMQRATIDNVLDGFLPRFIIVTGHAEPRPMAQITASMLSERDRLVEHAECFARTASEYADIALPPEVMDAVWEVEQRWIQAADDADQPDAAAATAKRLSESVLKTAALIAIDDGDTPRVDLRHYEAAVAMGERWRLCTMNVIDQLGRTDFQAHCDRVRQLVEVSPGGITMSGLYRRNRRLNKRLFDEVIGALEAQEYIVKMTGQSTGGRAPTVFYPPSALSERPEAQDDG